MRHLILFFIIFQLFHSYAGLENPFIQKQDKLKLKPSVKKMGPYFGLEFGSNTNFEIGGEIMYKRIRLKNRFLIGGNVGISADFKNKVICYDAGVWWKIGRLGFTYGATIGTATNFTTYNFRLSPVIGFKLGIVHFRTGIYLYPNKKTFERNSLFVSVRVTLVKHRDFDWR